MVGRKISLRVSVSASNASKVIGLEGIGLALGDSNETVIDFAT